MATTPAEPLHEGWLTKSPPSKRVVWKSKWRRRWFTLRQSTDLPGQYFLDYYENKNCQKLKGTIDLDLCDQVDSGLRIQRRNADESKGSVFSIKTRLRVYHLQADTVVDMEKWVEIICRVCGLKSVVEEKLFARNVKNDPENSLTPTSSGPYISISECFTGLPGSYKEGIDPAQFFGSLHKGGPLRPLVNYGQLRLVDGGTSSGLEYGPARRHSLTDSSTSNHRGMSAPPRPPKPPHLVTETQQKDTFVGPRLCEPTPVISKAPKESNVPMTEIQEESIEHINLEMTYENMANIKYYSKNSETTPTTSQGYYMYTAPTVNRELKPRVFCYSNSMEDYTKSNKAAAAKLQYLDLDLDPPNREFSRLHIRTGSINQSPTEYRTVDFRKTNALNMTRIDTEACRQNNVKSAKSKEAQNGTGKGADGKNGAKNSRDRMYGQICDYFKA